MKSILFVEDDSRILDQLRTALKSQSDRWDMMFVQNAALALKSLEAGHFDVIVSDMSLSGMDGAALLKIVRQKHPNVVRVGLLDGLDLDGPLRALSVAHQVLDKPCDVSDLSQVIERSCSLQELLSCEKLRVVGKIESLPTLPRIYTELTQALADPDVDFDYIAAIVEQDVSMSAKILQIVNSGFFGLRSRVSLMRNAISMLGMSMIRSLVLSIEVFRPYRGALTTHAFNLDREQRHALLTASVARKLLPSRSEADDAFTASMLHDIGKLVLATRLPQIYGSIFDQSVTEGVAAYVLEAEGNHVSHAVVGAYLLGLWGIPMPIVEAVAYHHNPDRVRHEGFEVLDAVHVANHLIHEVMEGGAAPRPGYGLDDAYLSRLGVTPKLDAWREMATEMVGLSIED